MGKFTGTFRAAPWLPENAIALLDQLIQPDWNIVETGSGASTFWLAERAARVISFEHNPAWGQAVSDQAAEKKLNNITIFMDANYPKTGINKHLKLFAGGEVDLALIDGRGRVRSINTVSAFIKPGGWIVLDNANRPRYEKAHQILAAEGWKTTVLQGLIMPEKKRGFTQFWRKPPATAAKQPKKMRIRISEPQTDAGAERKP